MNHIDTDAVRVNADALEQRVGAALQAAKTTLQGAQAITYSNFTAVHIPLAVVYTEAWNFQNRDLETKNETATDFRTNLYNNAQAWDQAEEKSTLTIDTGGGFLMGTPLDAGNELAQGALIAITAAACVIPDAWMIAGEAYKMQCDPGAMFESGQAWLDSAQQIGEALQAAIDVNNSLGGTGWEGADYTAFTEKTADYIRQMMVSQVFAYTVGIAIIVAAITSFIAIIILTVMAAVLAIFAAAILAAMASVVGFLGPVEALELDAAFFAVECEIGLRELDATTKVTDAVLAAGIGAFLAGDVGVQLAMGNGDVLGDLAQGTVDGLGTITSGLLARVYRDAVGKGIGSPIPLGPLQTLLASLGLADVLAGDGTIVDRATAPYDSAH